MAIVLIGAATASHTAARRARRSLRLVCADFIATRRRQGMERRMLQVVRELDHPGVLADMQIACGPFRK